MTTPRNRAALAELEVERLAWSPREVAASIGLSYQTVLSMIEQGVIPAITVGTRRVVCVAHLRQVLADLSEQGAVIHLYAQSAPAAG